MSGVRGGICAEPVVVVGALTLAVGACWGPGPVTPGLWGVTSFCKHRTSPTLLVSLPKSVSDSVQSVSPAGFGLGLASFFSPSSETVACLHCSLPSSREQSWLGGGLALWCISKSGRGVCYLNIVLFLNRSFCLKVTQK